MASRQGEAGSFLDQLLRRPLESNNEQDQSGASPSTSFAALVSSYDDLSSGPNPWQSNISTPSSPRDQQHSFAHLQRDLVAEYPWMQDILGHQRATNSHANSHGLDSTRSSDERSPNGARNQAIPARNAIRRRREQVRQLHCLVPSEAYSLLFFTNRNCATGGPSLER